MLLAVLLLLRGFPIRTVARVRSWRPPPQHSRRTQAVPPIFVVAFDVVRRVHSPTMSLNVAYMSSRQRYDRLQQAPNPLPSACRPSAHLASQLSALRTHTSSTVCAAAVVLSKVGKGSAICRSRYTNLMLVGASLLISVNPHQPFAMLGLCDDLERPGPQVTRQ